jgi:hypothetical protein
MRPIPNPKRNFLFSSWGFTTQTLPHDACFVGTWPLRPVPGALPPGYPVPSPPGLLKSVYALAGLWPWWVGPPQVPAGFAVSRHFNVIFPFIAASCKWYLPYKTARCHNPEVHTPQQLISFVRMIGLHYYSKVGQSLLANRLQIVSFCLLQQCNINCNSDSCFVWTLFSHIKGRTWTEGVRGQGSEQNTSTYEGWSNRRMEEVAQ